MKTGSFFSSLVLSAFLTGCVVGPDRPDPELKATEDWSNLPATSGDGPAPESRWWEAFGDPRLDALVEEALSGNLNLDIARARLAEAKARRRAAGAALVPGIDAFGTAQRSALSETGGSAGSEILEAGVGSSPSELFQAGLDVRWELDLFGENRRRRQAATERWQAAGASLQGARLAVASAIARTWIELHAVQRQRELAASMVARQRERIELIAARVDSGLARGSALDTPRSDLAVERAGLHALQLAERAAINRLAVLVGRAPGTLDQRFDDAGNLPALPPLGDAGVPAELVSRRPDLIAAEHRLRAAAADVGLAVARLYPTVSLFGQAGRESDVFNALADGASGIWGLGASLDWPIFRGGSLRAGIDAAQARLDGEKARFRQAVLAALEEVETGFAAYASERERSEALQRAARSAANALESAEARARGGLSDRRSVLTAELRRLGAERRAVVAEKQALLAYIDVYKALGGGWRSARDSESRESGVAAAR